jgi:hypothetical protein
MSVFIKSFYHKFFPARQLLIRQNGEVSSFDTLALDKATSSEMFGRTGDVCEFHVGLVKGDLK